MADRSENKLMGGATLTGPDTSIYANAVPDSNPLTMIAGLQSVQNARTANQLQQIDLIHRQMENLKSLAGPLAANPGASQEDYINAIASGVRMGLGTPEQASELIRQVPTDPAQRNAFGKQLLLQMQSAHDAFTNSVGTPNFINQGDRVGGYSVKPYDGTVTPLQGGQLPMRTTPGEKMEGRTVVGKNGAQTFLPNSEVFDNRGGFRRGSGGIPVYRQRGGDAGVGSGASGFNSGSGAGSDPSAAPASTSAPPASAAPAAPAQPAAPDAPAGLPVSLGPAALGDIESSSKMFQSDRDDIRPGRDRIFGLVQAIGALRGTSTGLGTQTRQNMLNFINALPASIGKPLVPDSATLSDYDIAKKSLTGYSMLRAGANQTDASRQMSKDSTPNMDMTNQAATEAALNYLGQERLRQAHILDAIEQKVDPGQYANRVATSRATDPKAFAFGAMTPQERSAYWAGLKGPDRERFVASVNLGRKTRVLSLDDLTGATGGQ